MVFRSFSGGRHAACAREAWVPPDHVHRPDGTHRVSSILASVLEKCARGDRVAFRALYDLQAARLTGIALRITRDPALARDAVQDVLLEIWRGAARFDPERGRAEVWLHSLVRYRALYVVRRRRREVPGYEPAEEIDASPDQLSRLLGTEAGRALRQCLDELEPERRRLIVMAFINGLSHTELADRLGQPLGTIKSTLRRSLLSLRKCLQP